MAGSQSKGDTRAIRTGHDADCREDGSVSAKKPDIWMPLYVADYQADTAYLTTEQHGAYLLMLMAYWRNGPIPDDDRTLASITRMTPDAWSNSRAVLEAFFQVCDGKWLHKRVEQEYERAKRNRNVSHDRAVKAAQARWDAVRNATSMLEALPEHMLVQCPSPSPSQSTTKAELKAPPIVPQGGQSAVADATAPSLAGKARKRKAVSQKTTLPEWISTCLAEERKPIPDSDPIREWAKDAGIPDDYMALAWTVFRRDWQTKKPQADWPATFRNAVRRNWLKLWYFDNEGEARLTTAGHQEMRSNG